MEPDISWRALCNQFYSLFNTCGFFYTQQSGESYTDEFGAYCGTPKKGERHTWEGGNGAKRKVPSESY